MKDVAIVYRGKHGSTLKYAEMIKNEIGEERCDVIDGKHCSIAELEKYKLIIFGGAIHGGGVMGIDLIKKAYPKLIEKNKNVVAYAVGINVDNSEALTQLREISFNKKLETLNCFLFKGDYDPTVLKGMDKLIMKIVSKMVTNGKNVKADEALSDIFKNGCKGVSREYLVPLIMEIRTLL